MQVAETFLNLFYMESILHDPVSALVHVSQLESDAKFGIALWQCSPVPLGLADGCAVVNAKAVKELGQGSSGVCFPGGIAKAPVARFDVEGGGAHHAPAGERRGFMSWMFPRRCATPLCIRESCTETPSLLRWHMPATD